MGNGSADICVTRAIRRRAVVTLVVGDGPHRVAIAIDDRYPGGSSTRRSLGPVGSGRYVLDLGLNQWRDRELSISATVDDQPVPLKGGGDILMAGEVAQIRLRDA